MRESASVEVITLVGATVGTAVGGVSVLVAAALTAVAVIVAVGVMISFEMTTPHALVNVVPATAVAVA
ncbi:MAG: hypothetical protein HDKAJFGB_03670 [Anaerolineae bacterium]|nr:hypothetical protein [Anaerolineae bacterium]